MFICDWIYKTGPNGTRTVIQFTAALARNINCVAIHSQVYFHRRLFADPVWPQWHITKPVGPLGSINQSWCGVKLLTMSVPTHPGGCVHICHLLRGEHHCMRPNGRENPPPACPPITTPPPPTHPPPIHDIYGITRAIKNYFKNQP